MAWEKKEDAFVDLGRAKTPVTYEPKVDIEDPDRIHEIDPAHVAKDIEWTKIEKEEGEYVDHEKEFEDAKKVAPAANDDPRDNLLDQDKVDEIRYRVMLHLLDSAICAGRDFVPVKHLHFPRDSNQEYQLRSGNPPPDSQRPKYLRGLKLHMDIGQIPDEVANDLARLKQDHRDRVARMQSSPTPITGSQDDLAMYILGLKQ